MTEAEAKEKSMAVTMSELEMKTAHLEQKNARTIDENKRLLHALEELNDNLVLSESKVKDLQEELDATHAELSRIDARAARTEILEAQLSMIENEQEELRNQMATTRVEEKAATARWKKAERQLVELEHQLERIDKEHALERARSQNLLERLTRRKFTGQSHGSTPPVTADNGALSRFVKEVLAENGHLQLGVAELRDMLAQSQEEIGKLREKLEVLDQDRVDYKIINRSPLSMELARSPSQAGGVKTVVHHHHYHAPPQKIVPKLPIKRPKKRRTFAVDQFSSMRFKNSGDLTSSSSGPSTPNSFPKQWSSSAGATGAFSSSSPISTLTFRESSIFDRIDTDDTSRPTSADSAYPQPWPASAWTKRNPQPLTTTTTITSSSAVPPTPPPFTILHTTEEVPSDDSACSTPLSPILKRSISHESILSPAPPPSSRRPCPSPSITSTSTSTSSAKTTITHSPAAFHSLTKPKSHDAKASITHGIAIRDSNNTGGSAYSRLLGLHHPASSYSHSSHVASITSASPPKDAPHTSTSNGGKSRVGSAGWFWRYVPLAPTLKPPTQSPIMATTTAAIVGRQHLKKKFMVKPVSGYVDEELLKESLVDVNSEGGSGCGSGCGSEGASVGGVS